VPDFHAKGYLEKYRRRPSPGYKRVMRGTLKELIEYTCLHYRGQLGLYRITVGTKRYGGQVIRDLFHSPDFPKSVATEVAKLN
jgi:hypothetical protein